MGNNDKVCMSYNDDGLSIGDLLIGNDGKIYYKGEPLEDCVFRKPDLVNVVRCRDCEFADKLCNGMYDCKGELVEVWDYYSDCPKQNIVPPDGFCAWGKRKVQ